MKTFEQLWREDDGQDLIEYALLLGLLGLATVAAISSVATKIGNAFSSVGSEITHAT